MGAMNRKGKLIVIAAPSGCGKTSVIKRFLAEHGDARHSISCTTRPMRPGETNGKDYHFLDAETFHKKIADDEFAEWALVHEHHYGTLKSTLDEAIENGVNLFLDLDVVGSFNLKKMYGDDAIAIFLAPPSMEELERRLKGRKTDSEEQLKIRLNNAVKEMTYKDRFDHLVVNDVLEDAYREIEEIIHPVGC
jgi:guanylate kinase